MTKIYFITGVNGVGKSAIIPHLKSFLAEDEFLVVDFDARGVPPNADQAWRITESKHWVSEGRRLSKEGKSLVICGFVKPCDLEVCHLAYHESSEITLVLLTAAPEVIRQRLISRYSKDGVFDETQIVIGKPINEFISGNVWTSEKMSRVFNERDFPVIDTSSLTPIEVAKEAAKIILASISRSSPPPEA